MKILIIGSGGREHALAWKIKQSPLVTKIYCAPGNGGISDIAECVDIAAEDISKLLQFAKTQKIDLTVVGPEAPLVAGIVDRFEEAGLKIFGPRQEAARLEGSKAFAKEFMKRWNIPTAAFKIFNDAQEAKVFLKKSKFPLVVKADGLAAGKGVVVCKDIREATEAVEQIMVQKVFKDAGQKIVIEECLQGEELSILAISDGTDYVVLDSAQDHKRIFDDDLGPNTGGMGAYSPTAIMNEELERMIDAAIIEPTIRGMQKEGAPFKGVLYAGLMITVAGPYVLEYNVRFGDPETQVVLPRMKNDLVEVMLASCEEKIDKINLSWDKRHCVCVVMSAGGYPGKYETGKEISGLEELVKEKDIFVFHAGTKKEGNKIVTAGGRVLGVAGLGASMEAAIELVYSGVEKIKFDHCFFRRDIAMKAIKRISRSKLPASPTR